MFMDAQEIKICKKKEKKKKRYCLERSGLGMNISWMSRRPCSIQSQSGCDSVLHGSIGHLTGHVLSPVGQDRSDQEQPEPSLCQGVLAGLLLWGGAEAEIWSLRHPWHTQHRDPRWRLPGRSGVHPRPGGLKVGGKFALHSLLLSGSRTLMLINFNLTASVSDSLNTAA